MSTVNEGVEISSRLELESTIGFEGLVRERDWRSSSDHLFLGKVPRGLKLHPDRLHMIYPLGCSLIIENLQTRRQEFLLGHNNNVSCLAISNNGKYIASGQVTFMGFKVRGRFFL